jgi:Ca-activated chloride channel family protein
MVAAQSAALNFIERQPAGTQIGVVAFARFAELIQPATDDQSALSAAVQSLTTGRRTAIGNGILKSLDAISEIDETVPPSTTGASPEFEVTPVPRGAYVPHIIVLLTDGASNSGPLPVEAARQAADRGVRVYTIGFGTARGGDMVCSAQLLGAGRFDNNDQFGGFGFGGFGGGGFRRGIDEETLKQVSAMTGGEYYSAESAAELESVFEDLPTNLITRHETTEISVAFTAVGALLAALAVGLALMWQPLP